MQSRNFSCNNASWAVPTGTSKFGEIFFSHIFNLWLSKTHKKSCEFIQGEIHKIFMSYSPDFHGQNLRGIFVGSTYENTIKKAMKILWKIRD